MKDKAKKPRGLFDSAMSRREALALLGRAGGLAGLAALGFPQPLPAGEPKKKSNIIFILTDDHRWDCLGARGHPWLKTPTLDRLAAEGVLFENAFVTTSLCSPSRASFLTGQYASVHGIRNNFTTWDEEKNITFPQRLNQAGYDCAFIGKWHMPGGNLPRLPGIDPFVSFTALDGQGRYFNCPLFLNGRPVPNRTPYITEELTEYALDFVKKDRERPFCLYLSHKAAHHDFRPPDHIKGMYDNADLSHLAPESDKYNTWTNNNWLEGTMGDMHTVYRRYCECLTSVDEQLGRLLAVLEEKKLLDDTMIVYAGDNGYIWGEHRYYAKHYPYEESIRIPFIVKPARGRPSTSGARDKRMVLNIDLAPTLMHLAGLAIPHDMQGESFLPLLESPTAPGRPAFVYELFKDFPFGGRVPPNKALRTERYKYIEWEACRGPELYDLEQDPREMYNLMEIEAGRTLAPELSRQLEDLKKRYHLVSG
ncbi:MAG: sulfatase-like hydrolase/transferase [Pseudomonadota bacterium]